MKKTYPLSESAPFMTVILLVSGYMNSYTFLSRGGVFANNQTGNMAKLGIELAQGHWSRAVDALFPILGVFFGALLAAVLLRKTLHDDDIRWKQLALALMILCFAVVGLVPTWVPHYYVNAFMSFVSGIMLSAFRTLNGQACNSTICTGNLRTSAQLFTAALTDHLPGQAATALQYLGVMFSFALGAALGVFGHRLLDFRSIWLCCPLLGALLLATVHRKA